MLARFTHYRETSMTTFTSQELNQDANRVRQAAASGPVVITDDGKPAHVLLGYAHYQQLTEQSRQIADVFAKTAPGALAADAPPEHHHMAAVEVVRDLLALMHEVRAEVRAGRHKSAS
jgi:prevent-host-death family protein